MKPLVWILAGIAAGVLAIALHGTARAAPVCTVSGTVAFGNFDVYAGASTFTGSVQGDCSGGGSPNVGSVTLDNGLHFNSGTQNRAMLCSTCTGAFTGDTLQYQLFIDGTRTTVWGGTTTSASFPINHVHNTTWGPVSVFGEVFAAVAGGINDSAVGTYSDTVTATINY